MRVPAIAWWPGTIDGGRVCDTSISLMDMFATFIDLAGGEIPEDRAIDSVSFLELLKRERSDIKELHEIMYFYDGLTLVAVKQGSYKLYLFMYPTVTDDLKTKYCEYGSATVDTYIRDISGPQPAEPPLLYNVDRDPEELFPLSVDKYKSLIKQLTLTAETHKRQSVNDAGSPRFSEVHLKRNISPCCNPPYCFC